MKRVVAGLMTLAVLAIAEWYSNGATSPEAIPAEGTPLACIERMFGAAADGDLDRYLNCFAGEERARLAQSFGQESRTAAGASLQATVADLKGWAVVDPPTDFAQGNCTL